MSQMKLLFAKYFFQLSSLIHQRISKQKEVENKLEHHTSVYIKHSLL